MNRLTFLKMVAGVVALPVAAAIKTEPKPIEYRRTVIIKNVPDTTYFTGEIAKDKIIKVIAQNHLSRTKDILCYE